MKHLIMLQIELKVEADAGEDPQFFFEEHRCVDDFIEQAYQEVQRATAAGVCTCHRASIVYIGPADGTQTS